MTRFFYFVVLMVLSSSAQAGNSFSFVVGGHRIRIQALRYCRSPSCVSVSIPGIYQTHRARERDDIDAASSAPPMTPPVAVPQSISQPAVPPAIKPSIEPAFAAPPPPPTAPSSAPPVTAPVAPPIDAAQPAPQLLKISHDADDEPATTPLGDWQTEGNKGSVRIERCGAALCGYVLSLPSGSKGETVLNMKPKAADLWTGNIYSRDSGSSYYATMTAKGTNSLRVEACALGIFFCSGNIWSRIGVDAEKLITSQQISSTPRS
jgi:uncharacterized protein (DUF2147 family)